VYAKRYLKYLTADLPLTTLLHQ